MSGGESCHQGCTLHSSHCTVYSVQCTVYSVQCKVTLWHCTLYGTKMHSALWHTDNCTIPECLLHSIRVTYGKMNSGTRYITLWIADWQFVTVCNNAIYSSGGGVMNDGNVVLWFVGLELWWCGGVVCVVVWWCGLVWLCGGFGVWWSGGLVVWLFGDMVWHCIVLWALYSDYNTMSTIQCKIYSVHLSYQHYVLYTVYTIHWYQRVYTTH